MAIPNTIRIYRMVHWQNVEFILQNGLCCRDHLNADPNYINIGHSQLIEDRHEYNIPINNAGNLGEYVPFYFSGHSPMLYIIMNGYKGVDQKDQADIVYLVSNFDKIKEFDLEYVYTNMNAKIAIASFYNSENDFDKINWDIVNNKNWQNDENNIARQDYKQAEFLVRQQLPVECITHIVVKSKERFDFFKQMVSDLNLNIPIIIDKNCTLYY